MKRSVRRPASFGSKRSLARRKFSRRLVSGRRAGYLRGYCYRAGERTGSSTPPSVSPATRRSGLISTVARNKRGGRRHAHARAAEASAAQPNRSYWLVAADDAGGRRRKRCLNRYLVALHEVRLAGDERQSPADVMPSVAGAVSSYGLLWNGVTALPSSSSSRYRRTGRSRLRMSSPKKLARRPAAEISQCRPPWNNMASTPTSLIALAFTFVIGTELVCSSR